MSASYLNAQRQLPTFLLHSKQNYLPFPVGETLPTVQSKFWYTFHFMVPQKTAVILEIETISDNQLVEGECLTLLTTLPVLFH